ncbi:hypothetical protein VN97_g3303 [Penicillium thymicola]|uniref:Sodium/calcium exchanger membrane region domain-containing protein n=1 Tax=Penicillium thymicola TaxID=293382 RepID=A0AAI9TN97_PENTH|nr:hypothetical protein VN97_g3303 [Penicillium thymicola]
MCYSGDAARLFGASNRAVTLIKGESYLGTSTRICTVVTFETQLVPNFCFPGPRVTSHFKLHFRGYPDFSRFIMSRRGIQPVPCGPEPSRHQGHQIQDADIDPWTQIQNLFKMPSQTGLKELKINHGWPVMILLPLAGLAKIFHWNSIIVLVVNIVAIIFLSEAISISSDELAEHLGELQGALLSATFGNTVELTAGILALVHGEIPFAQSVMVGSILSDILLPNLGLRLLPHNSFVQQGSFRV